MELKFHKKLYPLAVLKQAAADFSELASVKVTSRGSYHTASITVTAPDGGAALVRGNFLNYCLMLAKTRL